MRTTILFLSALALAVSAGCAAPGPVAHPTLGSLVTHDHVVALSQTPDGIRYSVETRDGDLVAGNLTREELETLAPGAAKHLDTGKARLIAD